VDIGKSVSRVGGAAQRPSLRATARNLRITMSRLDSLESLTRVGLDVDPATRQAVERGRILREVLRQPRFKVRAVTEQILALVAVTEGWLDGHTPTDAHTANWSAAERLQFEAPDLAASLDAATKMPANDDKARMRALVQSVLSEQK